MAVCALHPICYADVPELLIEAWSPKGPLAHSPEQAPVTASRMVLLRSSRAVPYSYVDTVMRAAAACCAQAGRTTREAKHGLVQVDQVLVAATDLDVEALCSGLVRGRGSTVLQVHR